VLYNAGILAAVVPGESQRKLLLVQFTVNGSLPAPTMASKAGGQGAGLCVCVCMCVCERERERAPLCLCGWICNRTSVCLIMCVCLSFNHADLHY